MLALRGLSAPSDIQKFLSARIEDLSDPFLMKGMAGAVARIREACLRDEKIFIHGDYDADGISGTAILVRTLSILKARYSTFLPDRGEDGYGVGMRAVERASAEGTALFVTVDCGIAAHEPLKHARDLGLDVIVIDHHHVPVSGLPCANVILNPLQTDCPYPFKALCAAGLVFQLSRALIGERALEFLDLAALATVADVSPLVGENRILVKNGLKLLSRRTNPGIRALAAVANLKSSEMNTGHIGFILAPRINAAGRMSSPDIALRLLLTDSDTEAQSLAKVLDGENRMRQKEERQILKEAVEETERVMNFSRDRVIVVGRRGWHPGVVGIVASRLVDRYHRPALVVAFGDERGKGSGRSVKKFNLFEALADSQEFFEEFGGHEQAAGIVITEPNLAAFRKKINEFAFNKYPAEVFAPTHGYDMEMSLGDFSEEFCRELRMFEPFGVGNPRPVFLSRALTVRTEPRRLSPETVKFWLSDGRLTFEALWADRSGAGLRGFLCKAGATIRLIYSVKSRVWEGVESLVLEVKELMPES